MSRLYWALLVSLGGAFGCVAPLDRRAPFHARAFGDAVADIDRATDAAMAARGKFLAGMARATIEAPPGVPLAGYGDRDGAASIGTKDPAYVRAFAVAVEGQDVRALLFTADVLLLHPRAAETIRARLSDVISPNRVFFTASHTHSGPGGSAPGVLFELVFGRHSEAAFEALVQAHETSGRAALSELRPAQIGRARVNIPGLIMNRVDSGGLTDDDLFVLTLETEQGLGALWSFGCHPVTLPPANLLISADYPGFVAQRLEGQKARFIGFAAGGVGSANPKFEREDSAWMVEPLVKGLEEGIDRARGQALSEGVIAGATLSVRAPGLKYRVTPETMLWPGLIRSILPEERMSFGALRVGDASLVFAPAEVSGHLTRKLRAVSRRSHGELALFPFNGSYFGYVVPRFVYDLEPGRRTDMTEYETQVMTFLGPWGGDWVAGLSMRLANGVRSRAAELEGIRVEAPR